MSAPEASWSSGGELSTLSVAAPVAAVVVVVLVAWVCCVRNEKKSMKNERKALKGMSGKPLPPAVEMTGKGGKRYSKATSKAELSDDNKTQDGQSETSKAEASQGKTTPPPTNLEAMGAYRFDNEGHEASQPPEQLEYRQDPEDGQYYTKDSFLEVYEDGEARWEAAGHTTVFADAQGNLL
eukprot:TRINITY_DN27810_c0_g1_i1.p1 TRINITY_DN27810_c0_g1~~TRINITY_DN27810_c0_g1_i1.p1  ORF type:complete len:191 (+),score=49.91 TRINITY_DN27810_c0_g1_i1:31-573(+)